MTKQKNILEKIREIRRNGREWIEKFHHSAENLMNSMKNTNENVKSMMSECSGYTSKLQSEIGNLCYLKYAGNIHEIKMSSLV